MTKNCPCLFHTASHGLAIGWKFDLPHFAGNTLYIPGRGRFTIQNNNILGNGFRDMELSSIHASEGSEWGSHNRLSFHNGTSYFFGANGIIGMQDRHGNTIRFEYETIPCPLVTGATETVLSRIIDSNGKEISIQYETSGSRHTITITSPDNCMYIINLSRIPWRKTTRSGRSSLNGFRLDSVQNQAGAITTFTYTQDEYYFSHGSKRPIHRNYTLLLRHVDYPSGARLRLCYSFTTINLGQNGSRHAWRLYYRQLISNSRYYETTHFTYRGDHTNFPHPFGFGHPDHQRLTYGVTVTQNNGLRTVYTFNSRHENTSTRVYNNNTLISEQTIAYHFRRLPRTITLTERRGGLSRTTVQRFEHNMYGQVALTINPLATPGGHYIGDGSYVYIGGWFPIHYRTIMTYDNRYGLPLTTTFMPDPETTIREVNTLSTDGRSIIRTIVYENNVRQSRTDFLHDAYGNVIEIREFPDASVPLISWPRPPFGGGDGGGNDTTNFITTQITFDRGTLPLSIRTIGVHDVNNALVTGNGTADSNGIVETRFTYNQMWQVTSATDPSGYTTHWEYDQIGRVTKVTHPNGGVETYTYNDHQNTLAHQTILGVTYTHQFDPLGNLLTITAPDGTVILRNIYDNRMRLTNTFNAPGIDSSGETRFRYDIFDRVISTERVIPGTTTILHRVTNQFIDILDEEGNSRIITTTLGCEASPSIQTFVQHDRVGRLTQEGVIGGRAITYTHDLAGRVVREQSLGIDNTFTYNIFGETSIRNIEGNTARTTYDSMGRMVTSSDFMGNVQRFRYDELGRLIRHDVPFERVGGGSSSGNIRYSTTRYFYDLNSNLIRTSTAINQPGEASAWSDTINTFRHNQLMSSRTGNGPLTEYTYDLAGNVLTKRVGGSGGGSNGTGGGSGIGGSSTGSGGSSTGVAVTTFTYNNRGQLTQTTDALGQSETFTYDANGLMLTRVDRNGTTFSMTYDNLGRLIREDAGNAGGTVILLGDVNGDGVVDETDLNLIQLFAMRRPVPPPFNEIAGDINGDGRIDFADIALMANYLASRGNPFGIGQPIQSAAPPTVILLGDVNGDGVVDMQDAIDLQMYIMNIPGAPTINRAAADINGDGRLDHVDVAQLRAFLAGAPVPYPIGQPITNESQQTAGFRTYTFAATGALRSATTDGHTITNYYDAQGRLIRQVETDGIVKTYTYNPANNRTQSRIYVDGVLHINNTYAYTQAQRLQSVTANGQLQSSYTYNHNGQRTRVTLANGVITDYTHNLAGMITRVVNRNGQTILSSFDYTHYLDGNVRQVVETMQGTTRTISYTYDTARRLTREQVTGYGAITRAYTFDSRGNRATMVVSGAQDSALNQTTAYTYDLNNRLLTETQTPQGGQATVTRFSYDRNGNQVLRAIGFTPDQTRYTYNLFNQLIDVVYYGVAAPNSPDMTASYIYRADGLRHSKTVTTSTGSNNAAPQTQVAIHVWDGANIVLERNADGEVINRFIRCSRGMLVFSLHHGFYLYNNRGDVSQRTDSQGNVIATYRYSAFGELLATSTDAGSTTPNPNPFRFSGEYWDAETGTYYLRARNFSPRLGRFTQPDPHWSIANMQLSPAAIAQAGNLYMFVMHNPVRWVDPTGLYAQTPAKQLALLMLAAMKDPTARENSGGGGFLTPDEIAAGITVTTIDGVRYRDVTNILNTQMDRTIREGRITALSAGPGPGLITSAIMAGPALLIWFYNQMDHGRPWDIKRAGPWNNTIGGGRNIFPGDDALVVFEGMIFDLPALGNFTYGYIGRGVGIPLWMLLGGSAYAAYTALESILQLELSDLTDELRGQYYVVLGYYFRRNRRFPRR